MYLTSNSVRHPGRSYWGEIFWKLNNFAKQGRLIENRKQLKVGKIELLHCIDLYHSDINFTLRSKSYF